MVAEVAGWKYYIYLIIKHSAYEQKVTSIEIHSPSSGRGDLLKCMQQVARRE